MYHVALPLTSALVMLQAGDAYFQDDPERHMKRLMAVQAKGGVHYSLCPNITKDGLCGCREAEMPVIR